MYLKTCLLVLLQKERSYGYSLANDLRQFGINPDMIDISIIYRALRDLEIEGLVTTSWEERSLGPQRRMYGLTPQGREVLLSLMQELQERRREIEALERVYEEATKRDP
ncbi:MAG: PadR family transcriptional regulator [Rectinema sp.]